MHLSHSANLSRAEYHLKMCQLIKFHKLVRLKRCPFLLFSQKLTMASLAGRDFLPVVWSFQYPKKNLKSTKGFTYLDPSRAGIPTCARKKVVVTATFEGHKTLLGTNTLLLFFWLNIHSCIPSILLQKENTYVLTRCIIKSVIKIAKNWDSAFEDSVNLD